MSLPKYSDPGDYSIPLKPPFFFQDMSMHVFPMRADIYRLQLFTDNLLNIVPRQYGYFRVFSPYAYLMLVDYGRLSLALSNLGWFGQIEALVVFPVEMYTVEDGKYRFRGWAWVTPFIFVDSPLSLSLGRTVIGWPKFLVEMKPEISEWLQDPLSPLTFAKLEGQVLPSAFTGAEESKETILEVVGDASFAPLTFPPDLQSPYAPWAVMADAAQNLQGFAGDLASWAWALGRPGTNATTLWEMLTRVTSNPLAAMLDFPTLNLKQFRDAGSPKEICFQAVTLAEMRVVEYKRGGFSGDGRILTGDLSCGFRIRFYDWPGLSIVESLGLQVARTWQGEGARISEVLPVAPTWSIVDMSYGNGRNLAWRSFDGRWHPGSEEPYEIQQEQPDGTHAEASSGAEAGEKGEGSEQEVRSTPRGSSRQVSPDRRFNTTLGLYSGALLGPFMLEDPTMRVIPLEACRETLQKFLDEYINDLFDSTRKPTLRFEVWRNKKFPPASVFLSTLTFTNSLSLSYNSGTWRSHQVSFLVPVKVYRDGEYYARGVVPAFVFEPNSQQTIFLSEVLGIPAIQGELYSPGHFLAPRSQKYATLLEIRTQVLPALYLGQKLQSRQVLVAEYERKRDELGQAPADERGDSAGESGDKILSTFYKWFSLKQFRDIEDVADACYQSIVATRFELVGYKHGHLHRPPTRLLINEYGSLPIVSLLGLVAERQFSNGGGIPYLIKPLQPSFWVDADRLYQHSREVFYRAMSTWWRSRGMSWPRTDGSSVDDDHHDHCGPDDLSLGPLDLVHRHLAGPDPSQEDSP